jgi:DNA methylase
LSRLPRNAALNAVCPYFTMFPLEFPLRVLRRRAARGDWVLDPFSGRGTTPYAARLLGLGAVGIDSSPVAIALTEAKLAQTTPAAIVAATERILARAADVAPPTGEFWRGAFKRSVLVDICRLRDALNGDHRSDVRKALRGIVLGALHGPVNARTASYFSNQAPRTYAPKPDYAVRFWRERGLKAPSVDVVEIIRARAERYYRGQPTAIGFATLGDSREAEAFESIENAPQWIVTSPPYYGMRTYIPDQWLRNWFLGGPPTVEYRTSVQVEHGSPEVFAGDLRSVWNNVANASLPDARMVVRFGGIADRVAEPLEIIRESFLESPWRITRTHSAGSADSGRRQALAFNNPSRLARAEYDLWLSRD